MKSTIKEVYLRADYQTVDLKDVLSSASGKIKIAYILHDKNAVEPHYHIFLDFADKRVDDIVAMELLNVCKSCVVTARSKNWRDIKGYMVHTRDNEYSASDIVANFDLSMY